MRLPLGVFMALDETDFAAVAEAGFNTVVLLVARGELRHDGDRRRSSGWR